MLTEQQVQRRQQGLGASEVAAVLGLAPYQTPLDVWLRKTGRAPAAPATQASRMGHLLEPIVAQLYAEDTGAVLREEGTVVGDEPWMLATPDRIAAKGGMEWLLEIKTKSRFTAAAFGEPGTDQVPPEILCQVIWQQRVTGLTASADVAVLVDGRDYAVWRVPYDAALADDLVAQCGAWWQRHVVGDVEPAVTGASGIAYLQRKFAAQTEAILAADEVAEAWLGRLAVARQQLRDAEDAEETARVALMQIMGEATGLHGSAGKVSWRQVKGRASTDWKALALQLGATAEQIAGVTAIGAPSRQFRFTPSKETAA